MLRHQHHSMQNQLRENKFAPNMMMGGPIRPMQQNMMPHQQGHIHTAPHRTVQQMQQHQQILSMHHLQHSGPPGAANPRQQPMLIGVNPQNPNGRYNAILIVACLSLMLLSGVEAQVHRAKYNIDSENLADLFGTTGCIAGTMVAMNRQMDSSAQMASHQSIQQHLLQQPQQMHHHHHQQQQTSQNHQQQQLQPESQKQSSQALHNDHNKVSTSQEDNNRVESRDQSPTTRPTNPNPANVTNAALANMKEKTPMCLVNELARFNKLEHQYRLTNEQGPAHKKRFTVTLKLGEEEYVADGQSIKKAQHSAATQALMETWYRHPPPKPTRAMRVGHGGKGSSGSGNLPPTVELNALAMKRGELTVYTIRNAPPANTHQHHFPPSFPDMPRIFNPHYPQFSHSYPPKQEKMYLITLKVGEREFVGQGVTGQAARHDAASRALEQLRQLPIPEDSPAASSGGSNNVAISSDGPAAIAGGIGAAVVNLLADDPNSEIKSPVSLVHETALKRGLPVSFKVVLESGKPHIRTFTTKCSVGETMTIGEGSSKKVSKKRAAELMLDELKRLPALPVAVLTGTRTSGMKRKPSNTKKTRRNLIRDNQAPRTDADSNDEVDPISRLVQIQQAKREREPIYTLVEEKGGPRRREFLMEVSIGEFSAQGVGPNKKLGKKAAADALLAQLGYSKPAQPQPTKPSIKSSNKDVTGDNNADGKLRKVTFLEDEQPTSNNSTDNQPGGTVGRQLAPGLLLVDPAGQDSKLSGNSNSQNQNAPSLQSVADALRGQNQHPTTNSLSPKDQLMYLAQLLNFETTFVDFPKVSYNSCLSLVSLSTDPPQVCHGSGATIDESRNQAVLTALRTLGKLGLDTNVKPEMDNKLPDDTNEHRAHERPKPDIITQTLDK